MVGTSDAEAAALVSKDEAVSSAPPDSAKAEETMTSGVATEDDAASADEWAKKESSSNTANTTARARSRSTAASASSVPPIIPQRSILRKPSREYQQPSGPATGMAARKHYYDFPPPPQVYHPYPHQYYPGPPPMMRPGAGGPSGGSGQGGDSTYTPNPPPFRPFGYPSGRHPHAHHAYAQHASAAAEHYQYHQHQQYAAAAAAHAAAAAQYRGDPSPRIAMGPGRGPPPPWLGGPGGTVSPLRPPPPRAHFKPEAYGHVGRRLALAEEAGDEADADADADGNNNDNDNNAANAEGNEEGEEPTGTMGQSKRDSKYDDALLLAEVSKIAETEAHHRKEAEAEANSTSSGSAPSTDGDAAGGIKQQRADQQEQEGETSPPPIEKEDYSVAETRKRRDGDKAPSFSSPTGVDMAKEEIESARRHFSDQAKEGSLASPVVRSTKATSAGREAVTGEEEGVQGIDKKQARSPPPMQLNYPSASPGYGRRYPPNCEEQYAEDYYPPTSFYPMSHVSLRMQAGRGHHRRGNSGELEHFYSPGGPYPVRAAGRHPEAGYRPRDNEEEKIFSLGAGDRQEHPSRPPPEYTPPAAYFNRHVPRQPSKHVEVTPNSHDESPFSRSHRAHVATKEGDAVDGDGSEATSEPGTGRSTQRRARFDETTERDQEDRDRRRAAEAAAKGSGKGPKASEIPPFPSPRRSAGVSSDDKGLSGQTTKPYLPPPRPSTGLHFPYQDDESRLACEYVPTVTPKGGERSKVMHTFSNDRPAPTPPPQEQHPEGPGWSPYPLNHHRRVPSGGFEFTIRPRDFGTPGGSEPSIVSAWGKSASWDDEEGAANQGIPPTPSTPCKAPRTPQKGHRKSLPSVSMDYGDSPPGNAVFTPRSSFESHRFLPPTPGGFFNDPAEFPAEFLDYGDYQYAESSGPPSQHQYPPSAAPPPPHMMLSRRHQTPHQQGVLFHPRSPQALASRQFATPSNSGGSKYPPLSAFQPDGSVGGYYGGGDNHFAGKTIIRRKCPWKNFPELEDFLIANRDEYLQHSAMNYTSQQRQYNNRLTERLLELAARHGYVFDEEDFDFVTVRDRIRCYYKSYVQSKRKKGIKVGYAPDRKKARKEEEGESVAPTATA